MEHGQISDESLMRQVVEGNRAPLDILVRRYANPLLTFIVRMTGDRHQSEELFQEVFVAVWAKRKTYNGYHDFKPWLYQIAVNKCRSSFRRRTLPMAPGPSDALNSAARDTGSAPDDRELSQESAALVADAVATLPEKQRAVLVLRVWSLLSYSEISRILNRSENTVRSNMHHALAKLRAYLERRMR